MTRELKERRYPDGRPRTPKRIDRGHYGRKAVFWTVLVLVVPLGLIQLAAHYVDEGLDHIGAYVSRLRVWSHPCLYGRMPKRPAPELSDDWKARLTDDA